jgi:Kef-type K+ transport system membrane component KefB
MDDVSVGIATVGALLLAGLLTDTIARRTPLPRVTLLMLLGLAAGPLALDLLPPDSDLWFTAAATVALVMIGFLLGGEFTYSHVKDLEGIVFRVAIVQSVTTAAVVGAGLMLLGAGPEVSLALAGIAVATAPAATLAVVQETGARGRFVDVLKGVVAVDDVIGIVAFSLLVASAGFLEAGALDVGLQLDALQELGGAVALGLALGLPAAALTGRIRAGQATLEEALGLVLLCAGLALWLDVSAILAAIVMGATIANFARHHERPFHEIERIEWPFLVVFFVLAGASLEIDVLDEAGLLAAAYVVLRTLGKVLGPLAAGRHDHEETGSRALLGLALLPQAGVALGLGLVAQTRFPDTGAKVLSVVVIGTVVFELVGPILTKLALRRSGSIPTDGQGRGEGI